MYMIAENEVLANNPVTLEELLMDRYNIEQELNEMDFGNYRTFPRIQFLQDELVKVTEEINNF